MQLHIVLFNAHCGKIHADVVFVRSSDIHTAVFRASAFGKGR